LWSYFERMFRKTGQDEKKYGSLKAKKKRENQKEVWCLR
jgi:hypothetical protein